MCGRDWSSDVCSSDLSVKIVLYPESSQIITANAGQKSLTYEVVSTFIRGNKHLVVEFPLK
jgi:hypothetical protein